MSARRLLVVSAAALLLLILALMAIALVAAKAVEARQQREEEASRAALRDPSTRAAYSQNLAFDPRDTRALVENSEEVFVGRVERIVGYEDNDPLPFLEVWAPQAQFRVEVLEVVKDASGGPPERGASVVVNQLGVLAPGAKAHVELSNEHEGRYLPAEALEMGREYVLVTEHEGGEGWHTVRVDPFGPMLLNDGATATSGPENESYLDELRRASRPD